VALAIVLADGDDDLLATVALALAIFAFTLQVAFFVVQLNVAREQDRRSADLYRDTSSVLTKIDERSAATVAVIREQFDFVLRHALGQAPPAAATATSSLPVDEDDTRVTDDQEQPPATPAEIEAIVGRALQSHLGADLLARWREISTPRPSPEVTSPGERARLADEFARQVELLLTAGLAGHGSVERLSGTPRGIVVTAGDKRVLVAPRRWIAPFRKPLIGQLLDVVRNQQREHDAGEALIVTPSGLAGISQPRRFDELRAMAAPIEILSVDELVSRLAEGWPGRAS
jgi:hypothetical protein